MMQVINSYMSFCFCPLYVIECETEVSPYNKKREGSPVRKNHKKQETIPVPVGVQGFIWQTQPLKSGKNVVTLSRQGENCVTVR